MATEERSVKKKESLGRRKIEIQMIKDKSSRQVTFSKRRTGLFKKASELSILCGAESAIIVVSPKDKVFTFGHPSVDVVISRYESGGHSLALRESSSAAAYAQAMEEYLEQLKIMEAEKKRFEEITKEKLKRPILTVGESSSSKHDSWSWWNKDPIGMGLDEMEEFRDALEGLKNNVLIKADEKALMATRGGVGNGIIQPPLRPNQPPPIHCRAPSELTTDFHDEAPPPTPSDAASAVGPRCFDFGFTNLEF